MSAEITSEHMRIVRKLSYRYPSTGCVGREDLAAAALERLVRISHRHEAFDSGLVSVVAKRAMIDELRKNKLVDKKAGNRDPMRPVMCDIDILAESHGDLDLEPGIEWLTLLSQRERVIVLRLGAGYTPREIGEELGICESRISQLLVPIRETIWWYFLSDRAGEGSAPTPGRRKAA